MWKYLREWEPGGAEGLRPGPTLLPARVPGPGSQVGGAGRGGAWGSGDGKGRRETRVVRGRLEPGRNRGEGQRRDRGGAGVGSGPGAAAMTLPRGSCAPFRGPPRSSFQGPRPPDPALTRPGLGKG